MSGFNIENSSDHRSFRTGTDGRPASTAFASRQTERIQQDRFARAGFACEHVQAGRELQLRLFD
jgi:hypothetical protein